MSFQGSWCCLCIFPLNKKNTRHTFKKFDILIATNVKWSLINLKFFLMHCLFQGKKYVQWLAEFQPATTYFNQIMHWFLEPMDFNRFSLYTDCRYKTCYELIISVLHVMHSEPRKNTNKEKISWFVESMALRYAAVQAWKVTDVPLLPVCSTWVCVYPFPFILTIFCLFVTEALYNVDPSIH